MDLLKSVRLFANGQKSGQVELENGKEKDGFLLSYTKKEFDGGFAVYVDGKADEGFEGMNSIHLRLSLPETDRFVAIHNHSNYWCMPFWGKSLSELPDKIQELIIKEDDGYLCILPVVDDTFKTVIRGAEGGFLFRIYSNCKGVTECRRQLAFVAMRGKEIFPLLHATAKKAATLLGNGLKMREERALPEVFRYFGWCSWDAMQIRVNHQGLVTKINEFKNKNVPVHFAVVDDMWADIPGLNDVPLDEHRFEGMFRSSINSFEGDKERFPEGMKGAIRDMKKAGVPHVGVWFPTTGYWKGVYVGGEIDRTFHDNLMMTVHEGIERLTVIPDETKAGPVYRDFCHRVNEWGGDFVKIDNQSCHMFYENVAPIGKTGREMENAIDGAVGSELNGALINCMGMTSECMFNRPLSAVSRCSDDFQPENREWFTKNILQCAYNGLLQGQYYYNDWDMWWTDDEQAQKNSVARAVSGGPVYVSDKIDRTRPEILKPLLLKDGRLLMGDVSATPSADCLFDNPHTAQNLLKIRNRIKAGGVIAAFNVHEGGTPVSGTVAPADADLPAGRYAYYEYFSKEAGILEEDEAISLSLKNNDDFRLYHFQPVGDDGVAAFGRGDLFMGPCAVSARKDGFVSVVEGGELVFVSEKPITLHANGKVLSAKRTGLKTVAETEKEPVTLTF